MDDDLQPNADRFAAEADLYDAVRPTPPDDLARMLVAYAGGTRPRFVVDLGSGSGLSTRWAASWADAVVGVEPGDAMRAIAEQQARVNVSYRAGWSHATGLPDGCADLVLAVQALHWMEPDATFAEVARLLRPGGVFAAIDCDWPPSSGDVASDEAWDAARRRIVALERRLAEGGADALRPARDEAGLPSDDHHTPADTHHERIAAHGVRSWSKAAHLQRLRASGHFTWVHEMAFHRIDDATVDRFVGLLRSQGDYQTIRVAGFDDDQLGASTVRAAAARAWGAQPTRPLLFTYRVRVGVVAGAARAAGDT